MPIKNASDTPLSQSYGNLPNVEGAMLSWFQNMIFIVMAKTIVNFQAVFTPTQVNFQGVWQPFTSRDLMIKPEGQRHWSWYTCHADPGLILKTDEVIQYEGKNYVVMQKLDYTHYGYNEYHLVEDYTGRGFDASP